jgi:membrane protein implicated in regulation of membrane protease activity
MEYILLHLPQALVVLGLILLAIEVLVLGFSTFVLFFVGFGTIITGILMVLGVLPATMLNALLATAIISTIVALISWQPMKRLQNKGEVHQVNNGMIGEQFTLSEDLLMGKTINHRYSGIDWKVKASEPLSAGTEVKITAMQVGLLTVEQVI